MPELLIHTANGIQAISFEGSPILHDLLAEFSVAPSRPCGGKGICGKCAVIATGALSQPPDSKGKVLACQTRVLGNAEVWLPSHKTLTSIETTGYSLPFLFDPVDGLYATAVDLGTTTIVVQFISLKDGKTLSTVSCENPQRIIAADVIGRIEAAMSDQLSLLQTLVHDCIVRLEEEALVSAGLDCKPDCRIIAGNTTMLYLYAGCDPRSLAAAPFEADCLFGLYIGNDYLPPCASAFVGADLTCAMLACQLTQRDETNLLIDIGTNGEIVLKHQNQLICCATAAGPAFEGCGISCGTGSVPGAIDAVWVEDGKLRFSTIDNGQACGICGSGLIDLIAALLDTEQLDETGCLDEEVILADGVSLTQQDVRQVQLAKGAIAAGIQTLAARLGMDYSDIHTLYIAGGFGSHLKLESAARIGLIPRKLVSKTIILGNASLTGARQMLLSKASFEEAKQLAKMAECINLASDPTFSDAFIECMMFEDQD